MLKARSGGYDGRGVWMCADRGAATTALQEGQGAGLEIYVEEAVELALELAVMVARSPAGEVAVYPPVETFQVDGMCRWVVMPPRVAEPVVQAVEELARNLAGHIGLEGLMAVELFLARDDRLLVNELAMRTHNTGHLHTEASSTSQFEQHLRAVLDLPLGLTTPIAAAAAMVNVVGPADGSDPASRLAGSAGRARRAACTCTARAPAPAASSGTSPSALTPPRRPYPVALTPLIGSRAMAEPRVGVVMGSDSDLPVMGQAARCSPSLVSPPRRASSRPTAPPPRCSNTVSRPRSGACSVIIAGAGGAAHLPGMLAAVTTLPVIGVPVALKNLDGLDSLLSIVQMPKGVPVATVAIDGGRNAGLLAARILAITDPDLRERLKSYRETQADAARAADARVSGA